jgi:hypothetical protein
MVTTRGRIGDKLTEELNDDDTITVYVPSSPKKRKQAIKSNQSADVIDQTITTPIAKKQKVAAQIDDGQNSNDCIVVETPVKNEVPLEDKQKFEIPEEGSNKSSTSNKLNPEAPKGDSRSTSSKKHCNRITQIDGPWDEDEDYTDDKDHVYMKTPEKVKQELLALEAGSRKAVYAPGTIRHKSGRDTIDMSQSYASNSDDERFNSTQATASLSATKTKQQRFGRNESEKEIVSTASQQIEQNESRDDDTPEEVTAQVRGKGKGVAMAPVQQ